MIYAFTAGVVVGALGLLAFAAYVASGQRLWLGLSKPEPFPRGPMHFRLDGTLVDDPGGGW